MCCLSYDFFNVSIHSLQHRLSFNYVYKGRLLLFCFNFVLWWFQVATFMEPFNDVASGMFQTYVLLIHDTKLSFTTTTGSVMRNLFLVLFHWFEFDIFVSTKTVPDHIQYFNVRVTQISVVFHLHTYFYGYCKFTRMELMTAAESIVQFCADPNCCNLSFEILRYSAVKCH